MVDQEQHLRIKCPHCGWVRRLPVRVAEDLGHADVVRGVGDKLKECMDRIRAALADSALDEANAWIDMAPCPHCENTYQYNVQTGECRVG